MLTPTKVFWSTKADASTGAVLKWSLRHRIEEGSNETVCGIVLPENVLVVRLDAGQTDARGTGHECYKCKLLDGEPERL